MTGSSKIAADRMSLPNGSQAWIIVTTAVSLGLAARLLPAEGRDPTLATIGGVVAGALAVGGLRSVSIRSTTRWMCIVGALLVLRFGSATTDDAAGAGVMFAWIVSTVVALILASRAERWLWRQAPAARRSASGRAGVARIVVVVVCFVAAAGIGIGPAVAAGFSSDTQVGDRPRPDSGTPSSGLAATERLDITNRPRLSDEVVLSIRAERIGFVRSQTFDRWSGSSWTRSSPALLDVPVSGRIVPDEYDLAATTGTRLEQVFEVVAPYASALPMAPSAESVVAPTLLGQWDDGSVATQVPLGRGATYSVVSRQRFDLTAELLRSTADQEVPDAVGRRYAGRTQATGRVEDLARQITAGADTAFDKAVAIEEWLDANTRYSLDAPLAPRGADVVDDFLFESKLGWCEQIASSFTVLLRLSGVPARLATGYVPEGRDPVTRTFTVRERDAHAWTEVWFPEVGWVQFDPTADIPLGGSADGSSVVAVLTRYGSWVLLTIALIAGFAAPLADGLSRLVRWVGSFRRRRRAKRERREGWPAVTEAVLERIGERWGRARAPSETATAFARELGERVGEPRLSTVGETIDRARFAERPPTEDERSEVAALLESVGPGPGP